MRGTRVKPLVAPSGQRVVSRPAFRYHRGHAPPSIGQQGHKLLEFAVDTQWQILEIPEIDPREITQIASQYGGQRCLFAFRKRTIRHQAEFNTIPSKLCNLILSYRRNLAVLGKADQGPANFGAGSGLPTGI
jgi:hypothetical protein